MLLLLKEKMKEYLYWQSSSFAKNLCIKETENENSRNNKKAYNRNIITNHVDLVLNKKEGN